MAKSTNEDLHLEAVRDEHFPDSEARRWPPPNRGAGWFKAPRALPVLLQILSEKEVVGQPGTLGPTYLELLSRVREPGFLILDHPGEHARLAGYGRERTWREAVRRLAELGFIETKETQGREFGYALVVNPFIPVRRLFKRKKIQAPLWNLFHEKWTKGRARVPDEEPEAAPNQSADAPASGASAAPARRKRRRKA